jgi:hypothetical protein
MAYVIIPAAPGTKFVTVVANEKGEAWVKVENEVIAWRVSDDGSDVTPIGTGGVRDPSDHAAPWIRHPDGTVEQPGAFDSFESAGHAEAWLTRDAR